MSLQKMSRSHLKTLSLGWVAIHNPMAKADEALSPFEGGNPPLVYLFARPKKEPKGRSFRLADSVENASLYGLQPL